MSTEAFDRLSVLGREALLAGEHEVDAPPVDGGRRWGVSVIIRPDRDGASRLDELTAVARATTGGSQWATGSAATAHVTVRTLEPHRATIPAADAAIERSRAALARAACRCAPVRLELRGLLVTPISVMLRCVPLDETADLLSQALAVELGDDGWYEAGRRRDIWYLNLVHFASPVGHPRELLEWVEQRRELSVGTMSADCAELVCWDFNGERMVPVTISSMPLGGLTG